MGFLGVYQAIYDYAPQAEGELAIAEGDLLYVLDKNNDDGWWKAKRKAGTDEDDEPEGLVPNNYVEPAPTLSHAHAIYEYTRQTDEELSFPEDAILEVFDASDPDWILAGLDDEYGFVPSNYIDVKTTDADVDLPASAASPALPMRPQSVASDSVESTLEAGHGPPPTLGPAAALAGVMQGRAAPRLTTPSPPAQPARQPTQRERSQPPDVDEDDDEALQSPALPSRPRSRTIPDERPYDGAPAQAPASHDSRPDEPYRTPGGFHMYNINEMVSVMGKRKKMPTTLGVNLKTGIILIAPERAQDEPAQEWTADKMTHYSREGKHVFMELVRPSKSIDFHAGAKDTAEEVVGALGELAGAVRAEGLREVIMAGSQRTRRKGQILYDFMAQGDDEVTVAAGDEVVVLDESKSDEWWQVRRIKNGKEGVVPSSYIEVTGTVTPPGATNSSPMDSAKSTVEQNRLEEIRLTKEAIKEGKQPQQPRSRRENGRRDSHVKAKSKPDSSKVRTWTDRSGSFSVDAQFLGLRDGKIHLHKMNGVKIAVPIAKMSRGDLECVENITGISLDDDKPLADVKRGKSTDKRRTEVGASVGKSEKPEYDWFQFFLSCDVAVGLCERYAQAFIRDSMDESVLPDVNATVLRTLGLREGDIIKVMRALDIKFGRDRSGPGADGDNATGGLFSGPGGTLRNNTRKSRPAPAVQTSDVVDATAFSKTNAPGPESGTDGASPATKSSGAPAAGGFDDDAWDVKPQPRPDPASSQALTSSMKELSLLSEPLQPTTMESQQTAATSSSLGSAQPQQTQQPTGASPSFFSTVPNPGQVQSSPKTLARQRPTPPSMSSSQGSLAPPPPQRPLSAPQSAQQAIFGPPPMGLQATGAVQSQVATPGQSLHDLSQYRLQQQYAAMQQLQPAMTAPGQPQFMQPMMTGMPAQQTGAGFRPTFTTRMSSFGQGSGSTGGVNSYLPPALEPERTGATSLHSQHTGAMVGGFAQPLQPQKTGPPPPPTGRRANLAQATPDNPFGF
ncbi:SH3 domain-containing protein [Hirsutella rhossiliensis]|uniref:Actin cytoskeleton-regulatory complex protein SLA1 n=1 Tax=Hirsutella rhossiliensis TaxID=111463 RepID=A0A9P8MRP5_9HYPO|nr:SH3 domain-containing protein [Hirsutella rhossiliensis]KAH0960668.1 SH3 domain-containing protein [Hirsutella rhossiliensis]